MSRSIWQEELHGTQAVSDGLDGLKADVVVVGAGITGASTVYWLHRLAPELNVVLVEGKYAAYGASGRNAGFLLQGTSTNVARDIDRFGADRARRLWTFTRENRDLLLSELDAEAFMLETSGSLTVAGSDRENVDLVKSAGILTDWGFEAEYLTPEATNRRLRAEGCNGGLWLSTNAMLHPVHLIRHLVRVSGVKLVEQCTIQTVEPEVEEVRLEAAQGSMRVPQVVLALNAYLPLLRPELGRFVYPIRAQMLATEPIPVQRFSYPVYSHDGYYYIRQGPDKRILLGGARHLHAKTETGYTDEITPMVQADLKTYLATHFPDLEDLDVTHRWSGVMGFSPDHLPILGTIGDQAEVKWASGFTGHGMSYGFRMGRLLAQWVAGNPSPDDLDLFTVDRFDHAQQPTS